MNVLLLASNYNVLVSDLKMWCMFAVQTHVSLALIVEKMVVLFKESLLGLRWSCDEEQRLT